MTIELTAHEARVIGCLIESRSRHLTGTRLLNALTNACNQKQPTPVLAGSGRFRRWWTAYLAATGLEKSAQPGASTAPFLQHQSGSPASPWHCDHLRVVAACPDPASCARTRHDSRRCTTSVK
jgi:hypothetical protein